MGGKRSPWRGVPPGVRGCDIGCGRLRTIGRGACPAEAVLRRANIASAAALDASGRG